MSSVLALTSHLCGLGSPAMRFILKGEFLWLLLIPVFVGCSGKGEGVPVSPTVISLPDTKPLPTPTPKPIPEPVPEPMPEPIDGLLEIGAGDRPSLTVRTYYDGNKNDKREANEIPLERAGLRLTPVQDGPFGTEKTGPGRIVRSTKDGVLIARIPPGLYSLEFVNILSPGSDPNAAAWASAAEERIEIKNKDQSIILAAFCQIDAKVQPAPIGVCTPEYDLKPRAFLAAVPEEVRAGQASTLRFRADDQASVTLEPFGAVESFRVSDFFERTMRPTRTTTYTLLAKNAYGVRAVPVTVNVLP
jgi:hypothetical protein